MYEHFCGRPEGVEVKGKWNPVSGQTALVAGLSGHTIESVQAKVRQFLVNKVVVGWAIGDELKTLFEAGTSP